jgi:hypothetical protein
VSRSCSGLNPILGDSRKRVDLVGQMYGAIADAGFRTRPPVNTLLDGVSTLLAYSVVSRDARGLSLPVWQQVGVAIRRVSAWTSAPRVQTSKPPRATDPVRYHLMDVLASTMLTHADCLWCGICRP